MWKASWKSLLGHKARLLLSTLSVVLGIAFLAGALTFTGMLRQTFDSMTEGTTSDVRVGVKGTFGLDTSVIPDYTKLHLSSDDIEAIRGVEGVESVSGMNASFNEIYLLGTNNKVVAMTGAPSVASSYYDEPAMGHQPGITVSEGVAPTGDDDVAIDAKSLETGGYKIGDRVRMLTSQGAIEKTVVGAASWGSGGSAGASYLFFNDATSNQLMMQGIPGYMDAAITIEPDADAQQVADRISEIIPDGYEAQTGETIAKNMSDYLDQAMSFINIFLGVFAAIALVVAGYLIVNTFSILVAQRSRELALYRALGASKGQVARSVVFEAFFTGLAGGIVGLVLGALLAFGIGKAMGSAGLDMGSAVPLPSVSTVITALVVAIGVTVVSAWVPARRASRVPPVAAMGGEISTGTQAMGRRSLVGSIITIVGIGAVIAGALLDFDKNVWVLGLSAFATIIGVTMVSALIGRPLIWALGRLYRALFGETGKLAELNAIRQPRRTAATASALTIGLTLVTMLSVLGTSASVSTDHAVRDSLRGDFVITSVNYTSLPAGLRDQVAATPGVSEVHATRGVSTQLDGSPNYIIGYPAEDFDQVVAQTMVSGEFSEKLGDVIITQKFADEKHLAIGDSITAVDPATMGPMPLTITGIYTNPDGVSNGDLNTNLATIAALGNADQDTTMAVTMQAGADQGQVKDALTTETGDNPMVVVQSQEDYAASQSTMIDQMLVTVYALLGLAIVIAVLGIVNTLALSIVERTRELGLLRAVGMKRGQLRLMITLESVVISVLGAVLGVVMGAGFGIALQHVLIDQGLTILSIPWARLVVFLAVSVVVGVLAAVVPARRAAKLNMLDAISSE